jgi:hypothetical protein
MSEGTSRKPTPTENPTAFLQGMIGTLYENPSGYASTVGELNSLLWQIHFLWSSISGRKDYPDIRCRLYDEEFARRIDPITSQPLSNGPAKSTVIDLWRQIDAALGIDTDPDQWSLE